MQESFEITATDDQIKKAAFDIFADSEKRHEVVEILLDHAFENWGASGSREALRAHIANLVEETLLLYHELERHFNIPEESSK